MARLLLLAVSGKITGSTAAPKNSGKLTFDPYSPSDA